MDAETPEELAAKLESVRAKRGYLLPHHGLLALTYPRVLAAYDAAYTALALEDRVLSHHDREYVWLAILAATDERIATHHITKFRDAGGTDDEIAAAFAATAMAIGAEAHDFVARDWAAQIAPLDPERAYLQAFARIAEPPRLAHLAALAVQTCRARWRPFGWHLKAAYALGLPEEEMVEAVTQAMFPGSIPHFIEACATWQRLILDGRLPASPRLRAWAEMAGQGGHDEVTGVGRKA